MRRFITILSVVIAATEVSFSAECSPGTAGIRVEARVEEAGLDIYEHGETAYNN